VHYNVQRHRPTFPVGSHFACSLSNALCAFFVQSRGSRNPVTGPASDRAPDKSSGGGYTFIDSSFPRRPGDVARLSSPIFPPTGTNLELIKECQSFALQDNKKALISGPNIHTLFATSVVFVRVLLRTLSYSVSDWWNDNSDRGN
jgi:hypothetical protein